MPKGFVSGFAICIDSHYLETMETTNVPFWKMNGAGNQIIVADMRGLAGKISSQAAIALDRGEGTKFDQIMELHDPSDEALDANIRILNSDGSEAEACGNGTRCVVAYLNKEDAKQNWLFRTKPGLLNAVYAGDSDITVDMGVPKFGWEDIPLEEEFHDTTGIELQVGPIDDPVLHTPSVANMGNPHCIFWAPEDVWTYELDRFGPLAGKPPDLSRSLQHLDCQCPRARSYHIAYMGAWRRHYPSLWLGRLRCIGKRCPQRPDRPQSKSNPAGR